MPLRPPPGANRWEIRANVMTYHSPRDGNPAASSLRSSSSYAARVASSVMPANTFRCFMASFFWARSFGFHRASTERKKRQACHLAQ